MTEQTFQTLGLNSWLTTQCKTIGLTKPTLIQKACIPEIKKGRDCIGCAKTGSGKTAAFALPILQTLSDDPYGIYTLILTPTRELAFQIAEQFQVLGKPINTKVTVITGGRNMVMQGRDLSKQPHIVVSTPGRLADHIRSGTNFSMRRIRYLVLDEADRLLEDNFGEDLQTIFGALPAKRQTLLFSATFTESLQSLQEVALNKPFFFSETLLTDVATVETLDQRYTLVPADVKDAFLIHILDQYQEKHPDRLVIVFTNTCKYCQILAMICREVGLHCQALHSVLKQSQRLASLAKFKSQQTKILIATDVASRGLDIPAVDLVINHNVPSKTKNYVHRVGRTARAGRGGKAITLVTQFDINLVHAIEEHINTKLEEEKVDETEVTTIAMEVAVAKRMAEIKLEENDFGEKNEIYKRKNAVLEGKDPDEEKKKEKKRRKDRFKTKRRKTSDGESESVKDSAQSTSKDS